MASEHTIVRRVEFSETDMAGLMHFSNYFRFMETAEHAFYRSLGFSVVLEGQVPPLGFPRVHAACNFTKPLRFEDEVEVRLSVREKKTKSLTFEFRFRNLSEESRPEVGRGTISVVCVAHLPDGKLVATPIPPGIASLIEVAPPDP